MSRLNQEKLHKEPGDPCPRSGGTARWEKPHLTEFTVNESGEIVAEDCPHCKIRPCGPDPESDERKRHILEVEDES